MDMEQYIGCVILWRGRPAMIVGVVSSYAGDWFRLQYIGDDSGKRVQADAFDDATLEALPDPFYGLLKQKDGKVIFAYRDTEYELGDHPYEPCLYIRKDGRTVCTLHNAFTADDLPVRLAAEPLTGIDGRAYDRDTFCKVLSTALDSGRGEMDFPFAASLARD